MNACGDLSCFAFIFDSDTTFAMEGIDCVAIEKKLLTILIKGMKKMLFTEDAGHRTKLVEQTEDLAKWLKKVQEYNQEEETQQ